ncbi:MAG: hypothetical protein NZ585_00380 [Chloracidobacterium sp.]|nr:hypothetical protein [Chloracidobacterium sp.]MDW8216537.1 hypothetical protein [Acidobacteriota bacterium]
MVKLEPTYLGKLNMILGSRYITQTDDDRVEYRYIASCGESYLFEVVGDDVYIVAQGGDFDEFEAYARYLAEEVYPARRAVLNGGAQPEASAAPPVEVDTPAEWVRRQESEERYEAHHGDHPAGTAG